MKRNLIFFILALILLLFLLPIVLSDYPFTTRPLTRSTGDELVSTHGSNRKSTDSNRGKGVKPQYQGYLAFMLICGEL